MRLRRYDFSKRSKLVYIKWNIWVFGKKIWDFLRTANDEKFVLGCNWISKISQKVEKLFLSWKKRLVFCRKILSFLKTAKGSKFAVECNWTSKISRNVQNLVLLNKIYGFFVKNLWFLKNHYRWKICVRLQLN